MGSLQDGSYSRGPIDIPVGEVDDSNYYLSPTLKFEQVNSPDFNKLEHFTHWCGFSVTCNLVSSYWLLANSYSSCELSRMQHHA